VKTRRDPYFPAEIGHRRASLQHIGNICMKLGRKLKWDPEKEEFPEDPAANRLLDIADINQRLTRTALNAAVCTSAKINLTTRFYPINEAGGDLVKTTALDYDRILLVLGDVSGHGLKEGFLSAYFQGIIEGMANQAAKAPMPYTPTQGAQTDSMPSTCA
jgi:hypothetical protein